MRLYRSRHPAARVVPYLFSLFVRAYVRPKVVGAENLPAEGPILLVSNHASHADTAVIFTALPRHIRRRFVAGAAQDYFFRGGPWQLISRVLFNAIPIARDTKRGQDPLRHVVRALREGYAVLFFPEGTRSKDGSLGPFRSGLGRLVADFPGLPIVPIYVGNTAKVMPKGASVPRPIKVEVRFGEPLQLTAQPKFRATWQTAANEVRDAIIQLSGGAAAVRTSPESVATEKELPPDEQSG
jgi:1-acyl-sn-glycerol-3-phosphate acyltransferase